MLTRLSLARPLLRQALTSAIAQSKRCYVPTRYNPFDEIQRTVDRAFRDFDRFPFGSLLTRVPNLARTLPIETIEDGQHVFRLEIDLPDFRPEDIKVTIKEGEVHIQAKHEHSEGNLKQHRQFSYCYSLPKDADVDKIRSTLRTDGRLVIEAPLPEPPKLENKEIPVIKE